jgi:hypothetical protein
VELKHHTGFVLKHHTGFVFSTFFLIQFRTFAPSPCFDVHTVVFYVSFSRCLSLKVTQSHNSIASGPSVTTIHRKASMLFTFYQWRAQEFFSEGGSKNSVEDRGQRERGSGGGNPLVRGSGGSCNLVQQISFHTVNFS